MNLKLHKNLVAAVRSGSAGHNLAFCAGRSALIGRTQPRSSGGRAGLSNATGETMPATPGDQLGVSDVHFINMSYDELLEHIMMELGLPTCGSVLFLE